jgi:phosphoribosylformylglycinamidine cyclo-ligase
MLELQRHVEVHAFAHVTGGGIPGNLVRVLPPQCDAVVRRRSWERPRIFAEVQAAGAVADGEMEQVFNLGLGMLAIVPGDVVHGALDAARAAGHEAWAVGEVVAGHGRVTMTDGTPGRTTN